MTEQHPLTEELAAHAALRQPEAFAALLGRVRGGLETWVAVRLGPVLRARVSEEDVVQVTFLEAYRSLGTFSDTGPGSFRRWLMVVAENRIKDMHKFHVAQKRDLRREVAKPQSPDEITLMRCLPVGGPSPVSVADLRENHRQVVERIEALSEPLREVLIARALEERTFTEIAERMGAPVTTVQARFARALREVRRSLKDQSSSA